MLEFSILISLELKQRVDVMFDLCDHKVKFFYMLDRPFILSLRFLLPNVSQQLKVLSLLTDHFLLLIRLFFLLEFDEGELPVKIVFFLKQPVQLP